MSRLNPISEERKKERRDAVIKELKSLILPVILLAVFGAAIYFVMTYQNAGDEAEIVEIKSYTGDDKPIVMENDKLKFVMDPLTTSFDVTVKSSGKVWHSTAVDGANDAAAINEEKNKLQSTLLLTYSNEAGLDAIVDSYSLSTINGIYEIETGDDYVKVSYSMGNISKEYVYPPAIREKDFDAIVDNLDATKREGIKQFYKKYDINNLKTKKDKENKDQLLADYPALADEILYILRDPDNIKETGKKTLQNLFAEGGYTYEQYAADKELEFREKTNTKPVFNASVIYKLDGDDLTVEIPFSDFDSLSEYPIYSINPLPYFGAGNTEEDGFMVVPEGGGSVINFNNGKSAQNIYVANVYGWDYALEREAVVHNTMANMNVFGISDKKNSFICILETGSAYASVKADISGRTTSYNSVNAIYQVKPREKYDLGANANQDMYVFLEELPDESIVQRYSFIDSGSYVDMAKDYQSYLFNRYDGYLNTKNDDTSTPVVVEVVGAVDKVKQIVGVPVSRPLALTTYKEADELVDTILNDGINNLSVKYSGWCNGGVQQKYIKRVKTIHDLGSKKDLQQFVSNAKSKGVDVYLDGITEYGMNSTILNGFFSYRDAAKFLSRKRAELYRYSAVTYVAREGFKNYFLLHGNKIVELSKKYAAAVKGYDAAVSFQDLGKDLSSDYYRKNYISREKALEMQSDLFKGVKDDGQKVMTNAGNIYSLAYSDVVTNIELKGSEYTIIDETIPFYQLAVHGYVNYTGMPINICGDDLEEILRSAEYGAGLSFTFMKESPFTLQKTLYTEYYASDFDTWHDKLNEIYTRYNAELGHVFNQEMTGHQNLTETVSLTEYEDGTKVYVNYGYLDSQVDGLTVPARDYLVVR
ncbi:MAG: DUF5696 domain-containing protein [Lachnospiraceae bacterium]|nr:DUF5696 domain-containing protein [Lachnospiraceae bacterium]